MKILKTKTFNSIRAKEIKAFERRQKRYQSLIKPTNDSKGEINSIKTSKPVARTASKMLRSSKLKSVRKVAASALCNAKRKTK